MATNDTSASAREWTAGSSTWVFILAALSPASAYAGASYFGSARLAWLLSIIFLLCFLHYVGRAMNGRSLGVLIDARNVMSLSRFQMVTWTVIVLSAVVAAGMWNLTIETNIEPLSFELPSELWILMGLSTTSLVASPLILDNKKKERVSRLEANQTAKDLANTDDTGSMEVKGSLIVNQSAASARLSDLFTGEEAGNASKADIARIQMFFITLAVLATYSMALWRMFGALDGQSVEAFPGLDESILALIGISHAGYLTSKAVSHSSPPDEGTDSSGNDRSPTKTDGGGNQGEGPESQGGVGGGDSAATETERRLKKLREMAPRNFKLS